MGPCRTAGAGLSPRSDVRLGSVRIVGRVHACRVQLGSSAKFTPYWVRLGSSAGFTYLIAKGPSDVI
jgi:hypothetical protein